MADLDAEFDLRMRDIYRRARAEADYNPVRFLQMLSGYGAEETAHMLLASRTVSEGYTALWERKRLDLTVEALVLEKDWGLFTEKELSEARRRLQEYGYIE